MLQMVKEVDEPSLSSRAN